LEMTAWQAKVMRKGNIKKHRYDLFPPTAHACMWYKVCKTLE